MACKCNLHRMQPLKRAVDLSYICKPLNHCKRIDYQINLCKILCFPLHSKCLATPVSVLSDEAGRGKTLANI